MMSIASVIAVWVYILLATVLEVIASYLIPLSSWVLRDTVIVTIALTTAAAVVLFYMELKYHPRWESVFLLTTLFFVADLMFIWTASLVH
jgi:Mlc titration factor MtfA (ptsG expression regulator)